jgi:HK97 family phage major capsid protein
MPYNSLLSRSDVQALIPEDVSRSVINGAIEQSAALSLFPRVTMSTNQQRMPVLSALPTAYFVAGDTGLKQTTEAAWANKYLNVEELAAIVPIPEAVLDDAGFDVWGEIAPRLEEAIGRALDAAIFFGTNAPGSWPTNIAAGALAASNAYTRGTNAAAAGGFAEDINQLMTLLEADGFDVNAFIARRNVRSRLRGARDTTGQRLLDIGGDARNPTIEGAPIVYSMGGLWPTGSGAAEMFAGDLSQVMLAVRQDLTYKGLDQAVITDAGGLVVYNLPQQDMVALRVVARFAWQIANPINYEQMTEGSRYPFAVLRAP